MSVDLQMLPLEELLKKFAAGGHKPGSGSAAALLGLISCALAKTVISISRRRKDYKSEWARLDDIKGSIIEDIEPALWKAFDDDSQQFDKVISARRSRDGERNPVQRWTHAKRALDELYLATEIPLVIAEKCLLLAEHSVAVFDIGFKSARGDSEVAIDSALSATTGAISIVYLNLGSFKGQARVVELLGRAGGLEKRAEQLKSELETRIQELKSSAEASNDRFGLDLNVIRKPRKTESSFSESEIEGIARNLQNELWSNRKELWPDVDGLNKVKVLDVPIAFTAMGYQFETPVSLGQISDGQVVTEVAGYINKAEKYAAVSSQFSLVVQRFTAAHELGHAVLHKPNEQFRDRSLDGSMGREPRTRVEYEADKFASYFLMPESVMREVFGEIFGFEQFVVSDDSAFALGADNSTRLLEECPTARKLSLRLAKAGMFAGRSVRPIAEIFGVSFGAMAIRLEELQMIDLNGHPFASQSEVRALSANSGLNI